MKVTDSFSRKVRELENCWITLADGVKLAARIWLPEDAEADPVPAILEYLPYRKRDGTAARDALTHPWFAGHGYAGVRVDMRGSGESDGLMWDEYAPQEQDDALEVIDWLVAQPWCDGNVGMMGISWGGFNGLQVAARRPKPLKAVISLCSTVDRFSDDIHYKGGCLLNENLGWSSTMLAFSSRPPDPALLGNSWREVWLERLRNEPHLLETWLDHQRRDEYWKHGSVCENYDAIEAAVLAVGGWGDAYKNAPPQLVENLSAPCRAIIGPWVHKYPHLAVPEPRIGFLQEALRWWDRWLKGKDTGVEADPAYRAFRQLHDGAKSFYERRSGEWVSEETWPSPNVTMRQQYLTIAGLADAPGPDDPVSFRSPEDLGMAGGEYCAIWLGPELPGDQRIDDGGSLVFDGPVLDNSLDILGAPQVTVRLSADKSQARLIARLCDVAPDGASERVTYGILNLAHRDGNESPKPLTPGKVVEVTLRLDHCAHRFKPGHRIRMALSTAYWPMIWPGPEAATLTVMRGPSSLSLPVRNEAGQPGPSFDPPDSAPPLRQREIAPPAHVRKVTHDQQSGRTTMEIVDDFGEQVDLSHGLMTGSVAREWYSIHPDDPLSAEMRTHWTEKLSRGVWAVHTETFAGLTSDANHFHLTARIEAWEGDELIFEKNFDRKIKRDNM